MAERMDKGALRDAIVAQLEAELVTLTDAANDSRDEATNQENKQEGKYDMRAQSAAYLAAGQAKLIQEIGDAITAYRGLAVGLLPAGSAAVVGGLIELKGASGTVWYFLGPARGGMEVPLGEAGVTVITPGSPLGRQLLSKRAGEMTQRGLVVSVS